MNSRKAESETKRGPYGNLYVQTTSGKGGGKFGKNRGGK